MIRIPFHRRVALTVVAGAPISAPILVARVFAANPTIAVTTSADVADANPGDGICETAAGNGVCSLRAAVMEANAFPGADTISLDADTYSLTIPYTVEPDDSKGDLNIFDALTIEGKGEGSTIIQASATAWSDAHTRIFTCRVGCAVLHDLGDDAPPRSRRLRRRGQRERARSCSSTMSRSPITTPMASPAAAAARSTTGAPISPSPTPGSSATTPARAAAAPWSAPAT